jgi:N utilization substance protein B
MARGDKRSAARLAAVQALYDMEISGKPVQQAVAEFESHWMNVAIDDVELKPAEEPFFRDLVAGVVQDQRLVDQKVDAALARGWPLKRVEAVLRAILRAGAYELIRRPDVPVRVVINEYVDVARAFYDGEEPGMVNAVLDAIGRDERPAELSRRPG